MTFLLFFENGAEAFLVHPGANWPAEPYTGQLWPWAAATRKPLEAGLTRAGKMRTEHLGTIGPKLRRITDILCTTGANPFYKRFCLIGQWCIECL